MNAQPFLRADDIHARIGSAWPALLSQLGVAEEFLRHKKAGPCPCCGGRDRYVFDNKHGRGDYFCRRCGAGDGFSLVMKLNRWSFAEARRQVLDAAGITSKDSPAAVRTTLPAAIAPTPFVPHRPPIKVLAVARTACAVADCQDAIAYLERRALWPLPKGCALKAHPSVEYWHEGQSIGRYSALIAEVRDIASELVTAHVTYLQAGRKVEAHDPRKILSPMTGREGCAVRLMPLTGDTLGIGEGIETALSAAVLDGIPVWAALNTSLLSKFEPPPDVKTLRIYADRDVPGLEAAGRLFERLRGRIRAGLDVELRLPAAAHKDFNDQLRAAIAAKETQP